MGGVGGERITQSSPAGAGVTTRTARRAGPEIRDDWPPASPFALVLQRARQQDQQALSALYKRFLPVVYRFVLARVDDPHLAEDLTADTFFAVVKDIGATRASDELGFSAWMLGIARSRIAQHFRRQQIRAAADRDLTGDIADNSLWGRREVIGSEAEIADAPQLHGKAQPIVRAVLASGRDEIVG
jgi:RNA polymerase sigma factor (sigma-70 family)